jgi:uncharacterized protein (TIGR00730 family)
MVTRSTKTKNKKPAASAKKAGGAKRSKQPIAKSKSVKKPVKKQSASGSKTKKTAKTKTPAKVKKQTGSKNAKPVKKAPTKRKTTQGTVAKKPIATTRKTKTKAASGSLQAPTKSKQKTAKTSASKRVNGRSSSKKTGARKGRRGELRRHLDERLRLLHQRAMVIEEQLRKLDENRFYRTCIFGSARIKQDTHQYAQVFEVARYLAWEGIDVLTGGGPGLMEAANRGALLGREEKQTETLSFGLSIQLEFEPEPNKHLDIKRHHHKFSSRLDDFMRLSHSVVCTPGGIGTLLEFFFVWQLIQVKHATPRPIVLLEKAFWGSILDWMQDEVLARGLVGEKDFGCIHIVDTPEEVFEIISAHHQEFRARAASIEEEPS